MAGQRVQRVGSVFTRELPAGSTGVLTSLCSPGQVAGASQVRGPFSIYGTNTPRLVSSGPGSNPGRWRVIVHNPSARQGSVSLQASCGFA